MLPTSSRHCLGSTASRAPIAADNDVVLKAASYRLAQRLWTQSVGVLGAARFVLARALERGGTRDPAAARVALDELLAASEVLEPTDEELATAAELERDAQRAGLALDSGESQLAAMVVTREMELLDTGDKRAITAFAALEHEACRALCGRLRCLEQLFVPLLEADDFDSVVAAVCAEPDVDIAITLCFACSSGGASRPDHVRTGLDSYIAALRRAAPDMLVGG